MGMKLALPSLWEVSRKMDMCGMNFLKVRNDAAPFRDFQRRLSEGFTAGGQPCGKHGSHGQEKQSCFVTTLAGGQPSEQYRG